MDQPTSSKAISSSPSNKRLKSYLYDASIGRQGEKIEYQNLHIKNESFNK